MNSLKIQSNFFIAFHLNNSQNLNLFTGRFDHWADVFTNIWKNKK